MSEITRREALAAIASVPFIQPEKPLFRTVKFNTVFVIDMISFVERPVNSDCKLSFGGKWNGEVRQQQ